MLMRGCRRVRSASRVFYLGMLAVAAIASAARSETLTLGGWTVIVEPPSSYCALDPARPAEADLISFNEKMQQPRNHVVMQLANCDELADFRAGKQQALGQLMRAVKDATGGKADMPLVNRLLRDRLSEQ